MKKKYLLLTFITLAGTQFAAGCDIAETTDREGVVVREMHQSLTVEDCDENVPGVHCAEYKYPATRDTEISPSIDTQLYARLYAPSLMEDGKRYPLLVFQHGIHGACGDTSTSPRTDTGDNYQFDGECDNGHVFVKNHAGYGYIANELAAQGYIVVSVNASRGIQSGTGYEGKARGRLLLKHLEKLARWDQGREPTPQALGIDLQGRVDFSQVGLMGHTQGSKSVRWANKLLQDDEDIDWETRLKTELTIRSIFEIAPRDDVSSDPVGVPLAVLLPLCDGFGTQEGIRVFDRSMNLTDAPGVFRATVAVEGANRNYFNTEWEHSDSSSREDSSTCVDQTPLFQAETRARAGWYTENVTGSEQQRNIGKQLVTRFFLGTVGADSDPSKAALFDPRNAIPKEITQITNIDRGFSASSHPDDVLVLEDFRSETGFSMSGEPEIIQNLTVEHQALDGHDPSYKGAYIYWERGSDDSIFQLHFADEGSGMNLEGYDTLDFRVDPTNNPDVNVSEKLDFKVQLVDSNGELSNALRISRYIKFSGRDRLHAPLQTARIPLRNFGDDFPISDTRGIRFTFYKGVYNAIHLASIRAVKGGLPEEITVTPCERPVQGIRCLDYMYPQKIDVDLQQSSNTQIRARLYAPSTLEDGKRYPVLLFQHGRHGFCGDSSYEPRVDFVAKYQKTGECLEGTEFVKSYAGYEYIANEMAAHGYIVVSVDATLGILINSDEGVCRGRLLLKHLEKLAQWDQGRETTPKAFGFDLQGHVDLNQVGMMGHSRGGISVRYAHKLAEKDDGIDWEKRLGTQIGFRGIFEIGPFLGGKSSADPVDVPMAILLPLCDGQVTDLEGVNLFDRSMSLTSEVPGIFRATIAVEGANHTFFNTEWMYSSTSSTEETGRCVGQTPLFLANKERILSDNQSGWHAWYADGVTGSRPQREVGRQLMTRFFLGTVGADRDPTKAAMFDPRNEIPSEIAAITKVERGFSPSSNPDDRIVIEEFTEEFSYRPTDEPERFSVEYKTFKDHDKDYRGAHIRWTSAGSQNVFTPYLTESVDLRDFETLDFRVDPFNEEIADPLNAADIDFSIQLVDDYGTPSGIVKVSDYVTLAGRRRIHTPLQTVRIPLSRFGGVSLADIRGVRFTFNDTSTGSIYLASIRATKGGLFASGPVSVRQDSAGLLNTHAVSGRGDLFASYVTPANWAYGPYGQENFQILITTNHDGYETDSSIRLVGASPHAVGIGRTWFEYAGQLDIEPSSSVSNPLRFDAAAGDDYVLVVDRLYGGVAVRVAGDVDGDGDVDDDDENRVTDEVLEGDVLTRIQSAIADVNCDNTVDQADMQLFSERNFSSCL